MHRHLESFLAQFSDKQLVFNKNTQNATETRTNLEFYEQSYFEVMDKYCNILESLPIDVYKEAFGDNYDAFLKLKIAKQSTKAKMLKCKRGLKNIPGSLTPRIHIKTDQTPSLVLHQISLTIQIKMMSLTAF